MAYSHSLIRSDFCFYNVMVQEKERMRPGENTGLYMAGLFQIRNYRFEIYIAQKPGTDRSSFTDSVHSEIIRKERN